jgi:hypothetical protein
MVRFYPLERPLFLFDPSEAIDPRELGAGGSMSRERDGDLSELRNPIATLRRSGPRATSTTGDLSQRAESTYLHIIGVMLKLMLGQRSQGGRPLNFATQESVVNAMVDQFGKELMGITERTLHAKFAAANRKLEGR